MGRLQMVIQDSSDYDAGSGDAMYNQFVQTFDFDTLVAAFDAARVIDPGLTSWALSNALSSAHLSGSDTAAVSRSAIVRLTGRIDEPWQVFQWRTQSSRSVREYLVPRAGSG